jgi:hypothetical protein
MVTTALPPMTAASSFMVFRFCEFISQTSIHGLSDSPLRRDEP